MLFCLAASEALLREVPMPAKHAAAILLAVAGIVGVVCVGTGRGVIPAWPRLSRHAGMMDGHPILWLDSWRAPARACKTKNPIPLTAESIQTGQAVFSQNCTACHGDNAKGDGPTASFLSPHPANLTTAAFWKQCQGAIFWKITTGHSPMPSFRDSLTRTQRWDVINYLNQTFNPAHAGH